LYQSPVLREAGIKQIQKAMIAARGAAFCPSVAGPTMLTDGIADAYRFCVAAIDK